MNCFLRCTLSVLCIHILELPALQTEISRLCSRACLVAGISTSQPENMSLNTSEETGIKLDAMAEKSKYMRHSLSLKRLPLLRWVSWVGSVDSVFKEFSCKWVIEVMISEKLSREGKKPDRSGFRKQLAWDCSQHRTPESELHTEFVLHREKGMRLFDLSH